MAARRRPRAGHPGSSISGVRPCFHPLRTMRSCRTACVDGVVSCPPTEDAMTTTPGPVPHATRRIDPTASASPALSWFCLARCVRRCQLHVHDSFKSSIEDLKNVDIVKSGTSGLQAAVDKVKTSLQSLRTSAAYEPRTRSRPWKTPSRTSRRQSATSAPVGKRPWSRQQPRSCRLGVPSCRACRTSTATRSNPRSVATPDRHFEVD